MSKKILIKEMQRELKKLNTVIDLKIIKGFSYKTEAERHKFLLRQLISLQKCVTDIQYSGTAIRRGSVKSNWLGRVGQFASMFMF